jgi:DNA polymerase I-like protein with 3'-5' exonuclease and polymerase domains
VVVHEWVVVPLQVHDEVMCPVKPEFVQPLEDKVQDFVKRGKALIPLLRIDWSQKLNSWADK